MPALKSLSIKEGWKSPPVVLKTFQRVPEWISTTKLSVWRIPEELQFCFDIYMGNQGQRKLEEILERQSEDWPQTRANYSCYNENVAGLLGWLDTQHTSQRRDLNSTPTGYWPVEPRSSYGESGHVCMTFHVTDSYQQTQEDWPMVGEARPLL